VSAAGILPAEEGVLVLKDDTVRTDGRNILEVLRTAVDLVVADPHRILGATLADTAAAAGVSQPTVIRFCTAIGCTGFQEFRLRLAHGLALGTPATHSVLLKTDSPEAVVEKIFDYTITSLDWARTHLDTAELVKAIEILEAARSIEFFGASGVVARDAQQKFPLFGVPCGAQLDSHQQIMSASVMREGDVAVVISNTGRTRSLVEVVEAAREGGAKVIAITGSRAIIGSHCDVTLVVETLDNTDSYTRPSLGLPPSSSSTSCRRPWRSGAPTISSAGSRR
jgi:RpiR family carbohydrate utilization transcriptional regulator